mgnify:CR=1 FL=1
MKKLKVCLLLLAITIISVAQTSTIETLADTFERDTLNYSFRFAGRHLVGTPVLPDSADVAHLSHKAFWRATAETVGMNIGLWAFDRYALKGHYAYISWKTSGMVLNGTMIIWLQICLVIPITVRSTLMLDEAMVSTSGSRNCLPLEEVPCGRCLWNVSTLRPMI